MYHCISSHLVTVKSSDTFKLSHCDDVHKTRWFEQLKLKLFSDARPIRKLLGGDGAENGGDLRGKRRVQRKHEMSEDDNPKTKNSGRSQGHAGLEKKSSI